jgi:hypothetical protein
MLAARQAASAVANMHVLGAVLLSSRKTSCEARMLAARQACSSKIQVGGRCEQQVYDRAQQN